MREWLKRGKVVAESIDWFTLKLARPLGVLLLIYSLLFDKLQNPAIFPGAITLISLRALVEKKED